MDEFQAELVLDARNVLGEGPIWNEETSSLYWIDILDKKLYVYDSAAGTVNDYDMGQFIGSFALKYDGKLVCAMKDGIFEFDRSTGELRLLANPEGDKPNNRFNDGKCDAAGRFWAGTMAVDDSPGTGALYCFQSDFSVKKKIEGISCSNGICWTSDNDTMYYIDTPTREVWAFDYDVISGGISGKRTVVHFPEGEGLPDGMTIDAEGMLWIAHWGGWQVSRWNPKSGKKIGIVRVPAEQVTSCIFGGKDGEELWITTARVGLSDESLEKEQPHAGGVFRATPDVSGFPARKFGALMG